MAADPAQFIQALRAQLVETLRTTDATCPTNTALTIRTGEPVLRRLKKQPEPAGFGLMDRLLNARMPACSIVDVLTAPEHWRHWTDACGPLSGLASQLTSPRQRYVTTTFGSGGYLGPTQTVRARPGLDRFQVAYVHQRHMTEPKLLDARVRVIKRYTRFH